MKYAIYIILPLYLFISSCTPTSSKATYFIDELTDTTFFKEWLLLGPFPNSENHNKESFVHGEQCTGFFTDYLISYDGERGCSPGSGDKVSYPDLNISRIWQYYHSPNNMISLNAIYPQCDQVVSYAFCRIISPNERNMLLALGSNDGVQVFLNNNKIYAAHPKNGRRITKDQDLISIQLKKGENRLLLKIENGFGGYGFVLRLLKADSPLIQDIKQRGKPVILSEGDIKAVFIDNYPYGSNHLGGYNGIAELYHTSQDSNLFVPSYAGFNLEHIFGGDPLPAIFEPRQSPMNLKKISENKALLHQPTTPFSHCESWTSFELVKPYYIDISFTCIIHSADFFKHGYAGLFWASYINAPDDKNINFLEKEENTIKWFSAYSPTHGLNSTYLGVNDQQHLFMAPNFNVSLAKSFSNYRFIEPFYYGLFKNMVFAYFFWTSEKEIIRFSQSPNGAGPQNPAWDFQFIIPAYEVGKKYGFSVRLLYKEFKNKNDILSEYKTWKRMRKK